MAEHCTGLMMSMPASIIDSNKRSDEPQLAIKFALWHPGVTTAITSMHAPRLFHHAFEHIVVGFTFDPGRVGLRKAERRAKLGQEHAVVGALLPAFAGLASAR